MFSWPKIMVSECTWQIPELSSGGTLQTIVAKFVL